jgi:Na+-translocating ferredoxin:NAD+ oxidoreductase RnfA subunit
MKPDFLDVVALLGLCAIVAGVWKLSPACGLIVGGVFVVCIAAFVIPVMKSSSASSGD